MPATTDRQADFYREFLMGRTKFEPSDFGIDMSRAEFDDLMVDTFGTKFRGQMTIDELLLRPRMASSFCDAVRFENGFYDLPDDIILRVIMQRRKNP